MTFREMVETLGKNLGIELVDEGGAAAVQIDGNTVILHAAGDDLILIHADLGDIAPESRDRVLAVAMEANFLYQGTGGATLAVNPADAHLHLQKYNWLERMDADKMLETLSRFAETVSTWKRIAMDASAAQENFSAAEGSSPVDLHSSGFMRV